MHPVFANSGDAHRQLRKVASAGAMQAVESKSFRGGVIFVRLKHNKFRRTLHLTHYRGSPLQSSINFRDKSWARGAVALLCILLVAVVGIISAVHVHADAKLATHSCTLCAVAHAGVIATRAFNPAPRVSKARLLVIPNRAFYSFVLPLSLHIRPPPQA